MNCIILKREEVTSKWKKLHNVELSDLYASLNIIQVFTPRNMGWAGHVARMERGVMHEGFCWV
jgi:hypothetical protein